MEIVAERLRALRHSVNISQAKLAKAIGLQQSAINRYENNQTDPSCDTLLRYADYFDVSADYILGRTENWARVTYYRAKQQLSKEMKQA